MKSVHEVRVEDLAGEVEGIPLDVDEGDQQVQDLFRRELRELGLQELLQDVPELEAVGRVEIQLPEDSGKRRKNS